jgi:phytoene desaturase
LQTVSRPGIADVLRSGGWRDLPFLLRSLGTVLSRTGLPVPVQAALAIWSHVAGQQQQAPGPLALVPAVIHTFGAWYPQGGIGTIPEALTAAATAAGVEFHYDTPARAIRCQDGRATGVETAAGEFLPADAVLANAAGVGTYLQLLQDATGREPVPRRVRRQLETLPLQSPGVCVYLAVRGTPRPPYLRFNLPGGGDLCRLLVQPGVMDPDLGQDGWWPARLIAPMRHDHATAAGTQAQSEFLQRIVEEPWWRAHVGEARVLATRIPAQWGREFHLYRESMNPVMTARFMRRGRLAHRSPHVAGLYLAGSATHPGQWVSFSAVSGVLAADRIREDRP